MQPPDISLWPLRGSFLVVFRQTAPLKGVQLIVQGYFSLQSHFWTWKSLFHITPSGIGLINETNLIWKCCHCSRRDMRNVIVLLSCSKFFRSNFIVSKTVTLSYSRAFLLAVDNSQSWDLLVKLPLHREWKRDVKAAETGGKKPTNASCIMKACALLRRVTWSHDLPRPPDIVSDEPDLIPTTCETTCCSKRTCPRIQPLRCAATAPWFIWSNFL